MYGLGLGLQLGFRLGYVRFRVRVSSLLGQGSKTRSWLTVELQGTIMAGA